MDECPHCGEPLEEDAESCPHCGSDFETGWKSDLDYYSVELPEDDPMLSQEYLHQPTEIRWETIASLFFVFASGVVFLSVCGYLYGAYAAFFAALLFLVCSWFYFRWLYPARRTRSR